MNKWYKEIVLNDNVSKVVDAIEFYEEELEAAKKECFISGSLEQAASRLPGIFEYRYSQLQEIEAILEHFNIEHKRLRSIYYKKYLENYDRQLTSRDVEKYIDGEEEVITLLNLINMIALIRNQYLSVTKSLDTKNFQIGHIVKLRSAGIEDAQI